MRARSRQILAAIGGVVGADELVLSLALTLVVVALWPRFGQGALLVPGLVLLYIALPSRTSFIARPPQDTPRRKA